MESESEPREASAPAEPEQIGPYRVIRRLADGGMGVVYLAEQVDPIRRLVTIKCIRPELAGPQAVRWFHAERQALARMAHPNIACIHDAGNDASDRPYLVMEYVQGVSITHYCFRENLHLPDRLRLMIDVCEAVQHAHHQGIIHKDLKPANVLVTDVNGRPAAKVIDFGIATAICDGCDGERHSNRLGTPLYMSPEQHGWQGLGVDTRSDIYSLGVMLYELVCASVPAELVLQKLGELAPRSERHGLLPSEHIRRASVNIGRSRGMKSNAALTRAVRGDLDAIITRAIALHPADRYQTALSLADDLRRFLQKRPVSVRRDERLYAAKMLLRRNAAFAAVTAVAFAGLMALSGLLAVQLEATGRAHQHAEAVARRHASLRHIISESFRIGAKAREPGGHEMNASELLERIAAQIERETSRGTDQSSLLLDAAEFYGDMDAHASAESFARRAVRLRIAHYGKRAIETAHAESRLAATLIPQGRYDEAEALLRGASGVVGGLRADREEALEVNALLADVLMARGDYVGAETLLRNVIRAAANLEGTRVHARALASLARGLSMSGRFDEAQSLYLRAIAAAKNLFGDDHTVTRELVHGLAYVKQSLGDLAAAEVLFREELRQAIAMHGESHEAVARTLSSLGLNLVEQHRLDEAIDVLERARRTILAALPEDNVDVLRVQLNLANAYLGAGDTGRARPLLERVLAGRLHLHGADSVMVANVRRLLGLLLLHEGNYAEASSQFMAALVVLDEAAPGHWRTAATRLGLAAALLRNGDVGRAESELARGLAALEQTFPPSHPKWRTLLAEVSVACRSAAEAGGSCGRVAE